MGLIPSKEQLLISAIEIQDLDTVKIITKDLTAEQFNEMCKFPVTNNNSQCSILHYATWQDNPELLSLLLQNTKDIEERDGLGWTPLMTAVNRNSKENAKLLLKCGAKIDCDLVNGMDLIAIAMNFNNIELIEILMDYGAQLTFTPTDNENSIGCYLLHFAVDEGLVEIAKLLIERGKMPVNRANQKGWSPLHLAAGHDYLSLIQLLLENGADVNIKDHSGNTPLAWAREMNAENAIKELEKHGGIADEEWHGEKLQLTNKQEQNEADSHLNGIENSQFEIDEPKSENNSKDKNPLILDGLQRQH